MNTQFKRAAAKYISKRVQPWITLLLISEYGLDHSFNFAFNLGTVICIPVILYSVTCVTERVNLGSQC